MDYNYTLIIPHFNIPTLLRRLLKTIPRRPDLQVIVVDDCSTKAVDEIDKLRSEMKWVEWYSTGINGGGGKARNIGLKHAKGKYVIFADADDYFNICFNDCLELYKDSEYDIVYFASNSVDMETFQRSDRDEPITVIVNKYLLNQDPQDLLYKFTAPWSKFISLELIRRNDIQFFESNVYNDMHFSLLTEIHAKDITADKHAIYCVTSRPDSVSSVSKPDKEVEKMRVVASYYNLAKDNNVAIPPLWYFVGPMMDIFRRNKWMEYEKEAIREFERIGVSESQIKNQYLLYILHKKVLQPGKKMVLNILNLLRGGR